MFYVIRGKKEKVYPQFYLASYEEDANVFKWTGLWYRAYEFGTYEKASTFITQRLQHIDCEVNESFEWFG